MFMSEKIDKLAPDFVALQADLEPVDKSAANPFFKSKYAPLPDVMEALKPVLAKHHFGLSTLPAIVEGRNGLRFVLIHLSGQFLTGEWMLNPAKPDPQGEGADTTYKRRFGVQAITGMVADEDDDGNTASRPAQQQNKQPAKPKSEADVKRDQLKDIAAHQGWSLDKVAAKFSQVVTVNGKPADIKTASADDLEAFITSLETGVVTL